MWTMWKCPLSTKPIVDVTEPRYHFRYSSKGLTHSTHSDRRWWISSRVRCSRCTEWPSGLFFCYDSNSSCRHPWWPVAFRCLPGAFWPAICCLHGMKYEVIACSSSSPDTSLATLGCDSSIAYKHKPRYVCYSNLYFLDTEQLSATWVNQYHQRVTELMCDVSKQHRA